MVPDLKKLPPSERVEVTIISESQKTYILTCDYMRSQAEPRTLYAVSETGKLQKIATAQSPLDLYPKAR